MQSQVRRRNTRAGFTLIEILIALVVLFIGIVGIIALFPIGIKATRASVEDTNSALIAESIHHAIIIAMRNERNNSAWIVHDGAPLQTAGAYAGRIAYELRLKDAAGAPLIPVLPAYQHHPSPALPPGAYNTPGAIPEIFQLGRVREVGGLENVVQAVEDVRGAAMGTAASALSGSDTTIDYGQYFWDIWVSQLADAAGLRMPLYQFRIKIWRSYESGLGTPQWTLGETGGETPANMIQEYRVLVAGNS